MDLEFEEGIVVCRGDPDAVLASSPGVTVVPV